MTPVERFINYAKIDTQANDETGTTPSSEKQKNLSKLLVKELKDLGVSDAYMDEYGIVYGHIDGEAPTIGLNAHIDTALEVTDANVNPKIVKNYSGEDIKLNDKYTLSSKEFPSLNKHIGKDLIVTDGNTLLGADDKAGIAIIMSVIEFFFTHPEIKHHGISVCFTVDEEIGEGPLHFSIDKMKADFAYTIDGGDISHVDAENFNAEECIINVQGVAVHPGEGKNALINAILISNDILSKLPKEDTPFFANYDDGYWHIHNFSGTGDHVTMKMILRDFDNEKLEKRKEYILSIINDISLLYPKAKISCEFNKEYENMKQYLQKDSRAIEFADKALIKNGLTPIHSKIRGGTDGATFSKMGLPTPNLGTGSTNHHGRYEYLVIQDFEKMIDVVIDILKI